jgi:hypothetical protein
MEELLDRTLFGVMKIILTALIMIGSIFFSEWLFSWGNHSPGIDMVYLPAGVRLLLVLRFRVWAAIGIALATPIPALFEFGTQPGLQVVVHALINGFALWLTVEICARLFRIQPGKIIYPLKDLLILTLVVSIALPIAFNLEYLLFAVRTTDRFLTDVAVMSLGDLMGCALVILPVVLATQIYLRAAGPFKPTA